MNRTLLLFATLLLAFTVDHFYQVGRADEARANTERAEAQITEAYVVTDALLTKYEHLQQRNCFLEERLTALAKANSMMIDRLSSQKLHEVMAATLPSMGSGE